MSKRFSEQYQKFFYKGQSTPLSFGTLCTVGLCLLGLIVATFTQIDISHPWLHKAASGSLEVSVKHYSYVPQIPILLASVAILGTRFSILMLIAYVLIGFFLYPVFAFGGGLAYAKTTFFGYILGYFPAAIIACNILNSAKNGKNAKPAPLFSFSRQRTGVFISNPYVSNAINIILASFFGVLTVHICGILYSLVLGMFRLVDFSFIFSTIIALTGTKISYDWIISLVAILASIPVKYILWLAMDVAVVRKPKRFRRQQSELSQ